MEFKQISEIMYGLMRVKEDRLLMKWEDDRGVLVRHIQSLTNANTELVNEQTRQQKAHNNLMHTIATFNPIISSLSPSSRNNNQENNYINSTSAKLASSAFKRARPPQQDDDGEFISINRNKQLKTGPMDAFFNSGGPSSANASARARASTSASKTSNKSRSKQKSPTPAIAAVGPNDHECCTVPEVNAAACSSSSTNKNKASSNASGGSSSSGLGSVASASAFASTTAAEDLDMDMITQFIVPSGNPVMQNQHSATSTTAQAQTLMPPAQTSVATGHFGVKNSNDSSRLLNADGDGEGGSDVDDDVTVDPDGDGDGDAPNRQAAEHTSTTATVIPRPASTKTFIDLISPILPCDGDVADMALGEDDADMHYTNTLTHSNGGAEVDGADDMGVDVDATQDCSQTTCGSTPGTTSHNNARNSTYAHINTGSKASTISSHSSGSSAVPTNHWPKQTRPYGAHGALSRLPSQSQTQSQLLSQEFNVTVRKSTDFSAPSEAEKEDERDHEETDNPYFPALEENTCTLLRPSLLCKRDEIIDLSVSPQKEVKFKSRRVSGCVTFGALDGEGEDQQGSNAHTTHATELAPRIMGPLVLPTDTTGALFSPKSGTRGRRSKEARSSLDKSNTSLLVDACVGASPEVSPVPAINRSVMSSVSHKFAQSEPVSAARAPYLNTIVTTASPVLADTMLVSSARSVADIASAGAVDYMAEPGADLTYLYSNGANISSNSAQSKGRGRPAVQPADVDMYAQECAVTVAKSSSSSAGSAGNGSNGASRRRQSDVAEKENMVNRYTTAGTSSGGGRVGKLNATTGTAAAEWRSGVSNSNGASSSGACASASGSGDNGAGQGNSTVSTNKCVETVRSKIQRAALPGHTCEECVRFYETMQQQGIFNFTDSQMKREILQTCSRHKARWTPPSTPDGFWELTLQTPDDWK